MRAYTSRMVDALKTCLDQREWEPKPINPRMGHCFPLFFVPFCEYLLSWTGGVKESQQTVISSSTVVTCAQISPAGFNQSHLQFLKPLGPWDANSRSHLCGRLVSAERVSGLGGGRERHPRVSWRREPHTEDFCPGLCVKAGTM